MAEYHYSRPPKAIPGFITLTEETGEQMSFALHAITSIQPDKSSQGNAIIRLLGTPAALRVKETHEEIMSLIHQAQHPAS
jgi:hypothetical protein